MESTCTLFVRLKMNDEEIKIAIVGDCSNWNQRDITRDDVPLEIINKINECDVFIFNLEGPIINNKIVPMGVIKNRLVKKFLDIYGKLQPNVTNTENILNVLNLTKINVACLANNHILDAGKKGIDFTLESLEKNGFLFIGAGRNISEASKPLTIEVKGTKIGILNYNFIGWRKYGHFVNIFGATRKRAGANYARKKEIIGDVLSLSEHVDYTIAVVHIGKELHDNLSIEEQQLLESLEADLIVVHHAHMTQSINSEMIISCGDFIFNYPENLPENRMGQLVMIDVNKEIDVVVEQFYLENGMCNGSN